METFEPDFYYLIRHPDNELVGVHKSKEKYGDKAMLGAYLLEMTNQATVETLQAFNAVGQFAEGDDDSIWVDYSVMIPADILDNQK